MNTVAHLIKTLEHNIEHTIVDSNNSIWIG
jgi:hypothetical protein